MRTSASLLAETRAEEAPGAEQSARVAGHGVGRTTKSRPSRRFRTAAAPPAPGCISFITRTWKGLFSTCASKFVRKEPQPKTSSTPPLCRCDWSPERQTGVPRLRDAKAARRQGARACLYRNRIAASLMACGAGLSGGVGRKTAMPPVDHGRRWPHHHPTLVTGLVIDGKVGVSCWRERLRRSATMQAAGSVRVRGRLPFPPPYTRDPLFVT